MNFQFSGLWSAMFTPTDATGAPEMEQLERLTELLITQGQDGLYILGSTGAGCIIYGRAAESRAEESNAGGGGPFAGNGSGRCAYYCRVCKACAARCHAWSRRNFLGRPYLLYRFCRKRITALQCYRPCNSASFFPYQLGSNTMGDISVFIDKLLSIPNVAGMKLTTGQLMEISSIHLKAGERLRLFSGADELMCHASLCGAVGAIGSFYNLWGQACQKVLQSFKNGNYELGKSFMLEFQKTILYVLPNIWTFFRKAMHLKYGIDIGPAKAPLGTSQKEWSDEEVLAISNKIESVAGLVTV